MDMSQYRDLFLLEAREHLNNMNRLVVTLETSGGDRETVDALFREAHSIKGMAATMEFMETTELSHCLEGFLDKFRHSKQISTADFDRLLEGIDLLESLLDDLSAGRPERAIADFVRQPVSAQKGPDAVAAEQTVSKKVPECRDSGRTAVFAEPGAESDTRQQIPHQERLIFQSIIDLRQETPMPVGCARLVLQMLAESGELLSVQPNIESLCADHSLLQFKVWIKTGLSTDQIKQKVMTFPEVKQVTFREDRRMERSQDVFRMIRIDTALLDRLVDLTGELITNRNMLETAFSGPDPEGLTHVLAQNDQLLSELHHSVMQARLLPFESITSRMHRLVRDFERKTGKKLSLRVFGGETGIDRVVLERLSDPLVHLLRNAIDHGFSGHGNITLTARREKDLVLIEVADDGRGIDPEQVRNQAVQKGLMTSSQAERLSDRDALMLICQPGFSTLDEASETSGRGVGMDVVKTTVEKLGGLLDVLSEPGQGTRVQMWMPFSVALIKILHVHCGGEEVGIPLTRVKRTLEVASAAIKKSDCGRTFEHGGKAIPLVSLADLVGLVENNEIKTASVVLTEANGREVGLQVEHLKGLKEAFVKRLDFPFNHLKGLIGATIAGDGRILFLVDPHPLLEGSPPQNDPS